MVKSLLNSSITYLEDKGISIEDVEKEGQLYEYELFKGVSVHLATGNFKYDYINKNIIFFPIYLVEDAEKIVSQIGVFELLNIDLPNILDKDGDVDLNNLNDPLLYSFVNEEYISQYAIKKESKISMQPQLSIKRDDNNEGDEYVIPAQQNIEEQLLDLPLDVFEDDEEPEITFNIDETKNWVQKIMRSSKYGIVDNEGAGDCLFASLRDAYAGIGKVLSIAKLREIVANSANEELFMNYKTIYDSLNSELEKLTEERNSLKDTAKAMSSTGKAEKDRLKKRAIIDEINKLKEHLSEIVNNIAITKNNLSEFKFMKGINDLMTFKKKIKTCNFWGDVWAIHTLERILNIKIIILSSENYNKDDLNNILLCGQLEENIDRFEPEYYVILDYTGSHYRLITYKGKTLFKFDELPRSIKNKIVDICMIKNAGFYSIIPEFQKLKQEREEK